LSFLKVEVKISYHIKSFQLYHSPTYPKRIEMRIDIHPNTHQTAQKYEMLKETKEENTIRYKLIRTNNHHSNGYAKCKIYRVS